MLRKTFQTYLKEIIFLTISLFFYLFDIGNVAGLRQGTEALYLQISKEMFETPSFITPLFHGLPHWSKPPMHFWIPFPLYFIFKSTALEMARGSIAILTILSSCHFAYWLQKRFQISLITTLAIFLGCLGMIKFGRTYMMEIPLTLLTASSTLMFYDYILEKKKNLLIASSILLACAILVKGPVALVMSAGGIVLFSSIKSYQNKKIWNLRPITLYMSISLLLSSIWFIVAYVIHGEEVIEYFFLRENLGKFAQMNYPARKIFQGLLLYSVPWIFILPTIFKQKHLLKNEPFLYLLINFIFFFGIWFIPSQRSHHYAIPALPFFLSILAITTSNIKLNTERALLLIPVLMLTILLLAISPLIPITTWQIYLNIFLTISTLITIYFVKEKRYISYWLISINILWLWTISVPTFYLPNFPGKYIPLTKNGNVAFASTRTYFYEQVLGTKVIPIGTEKFENFLETNGNVAIVYESQDFEIDPSKFETLATWKKWIRVITVNDILNAYKALDINKLQENIYLIKKK